MIWNLPIETTIKNWLLGVPGTYILLHSFDALGSFFSQSIYQTTGMAFSERELFFPQNGKTISVVWKTSSNLSRIHEG